MDAPKVDRADQMDSSPNVADAEEKVGLFHQSATVVALNVSMKRGGRNEAVDD